MTVTVQAFRNGTDHLFQITRDFHACVNAAERRNWLAVRGRMIAFYETATCTRAKPRDLERRVEALRQLGVLSDKVELENGPLPEAPRLWLVR